MKQIITILVIGIVSFAIICNSQLWPCEDTQNNIDSLRKNTLLFSIMLSNSGLFSIKPIKKNNSRNKNQPRFIVTEEKKALTFSKIQKINGSQRIQAQNTDPDFKRSETLLSFPYLLTSFFLLFFIYFHTKRNQRKDLKKEERNRQQKEIEKTFNKKEDVLHTILLEHFEIIKKTAILEGYLRQDEKKSGEHLIKLFNNIVFGKEKRDWGRLYTVMNELHNGTLKQILIEFPNLDEIEFRICCLTISEFSNTEIAIVLGYSPNTIQMKKSAIRKKLGIENFGSFQKFFEEKMK
ncbi:LuxR C-terminal-related transcriptional regulator [Marinilabilia salmonicolor]|uniref:Regulatory LuxR family protein n=1 Tax=Marinilabilia salmonicolor TaxID=989 RepID=A0A368UNQ0_9BACT|nr:LuxR C-terminal-related transcriptional regulator [Marinilabilia salmonicolor]RCW21180.1 regulatory LuxR family protein [Marinilabilia salmonicolor]